MVTVTAAAESGRRPFDVRGMTAASGAAATVRDDDDNNYSLALCSQLPNFYQKLDSLRKYNVFHSTSKQGGCVPTWLRYHTPPVNMALETVRIKIILGLETSSLYF